MKKIICYGDSNTFGFIPKTHLRYKKEERWSGILSTLLPNYEVIEEGMCNRTAFMKNPQGKDFCGIEHLPILLKKHTSCDIFIWALGTNDAQIQYDINGDIVRENLEKIIKILKESSSKIIIVPPVKITENISKDFFKTLFSSNSIQKINNTFLIYEEIAKEENCYYFDFNNIVKSSELDGIHYDKKSHAIIAEEFAKFILSL